MSNTKMRGAVNANFKFRPDTLLHCHTRTDPRVGRVYDDIHGTNS